MTEPEALALLRHHAFSHDDYNHPKSAKGFLGMLRPCTGELYEANFQELVDVIRTLRDHLRSGRIEKEIVSDLWAIVHYTRCWAIAEDGMLRRNNTLTDEQIKQLITWTDRISEEVMNLLES